MHPELQDERAIIVSVALEVDDLVEPRAELGPVDPPPDPVDQRTRYQALRKNPIRPFGGKSRQNRQYSGRSRSSSDGWPVGTRQQPARIHPLVEQVHAFALAGAVHASKEDDDRRSPILAEP